jgi:hypothetical protein
LTVGDQDDVKLVQWLVDESDIVLLHGGVLGPRIRKLGERSQKGLNARAGDLAELAREDRLTSASAYRCCENDLLWKGEY